MPLKFFGDVLLEQDSNGFLFWGENVGILFEMLSQDCKPYDCSVYCKAEIEIKYIQDQREQGLKWRRKILKPVTTI